uniref:Reverse transcriptase domain-containing protein n=1 Tax=Tanacetum cinerariifolium TaxID=118510 RepID=A0A699JZ07_TANCI|nr:reverse transcriptase domain-containing protein [Tanacetum cinerariifolium]
MCTNEQTSVSQPTSAVRNTLGKEQVPQDLGRPASDASLREYCDRNYHQVLPIIARKCTKRRRRNLKERLGSRHARSMYGSPKPRRGYSESPRKRGPERRTVFKRLDKGVFHGLGDKGKGTSAYLNDSKRRSYHSSRRDTESYYQSSRSRETEFASEKRHNKRASSRRTKALSESEGSTEGHWKSKPKRQKSSVEDDLELPPAEKCIKDLVEIHNIKQKDGESIKEFVQRYKLECRDVKEAPECMKISKFMHGITNPRLIKRMHDKIPKLVDEIMMVTTTFLRGEVAASNHDRKKSFPSWKQQEAEQKQNFKKGGFRNQQRPERKQDRFTLLTKTPKEILALDKGKFKAPLPMTTPVEKRNASKFCEFHREWKRPGEGDKKGETSGKDKPLAILMVQPWQRVDRQKVTQTFSSESVISFPPLGEEDWTEGPMIIETEKRGHCVHRMYVDGVSSSKILYEHCFNRFRLEFRNQMIPATTPLVGFSREIVWPIGQISLLVKIGDEEHSTSA